MKCFVGSSPSEDCAAIPHDHPCEQAHKCFVELHHTGGKYAAKGTVKLKSGNFIGKCHSPTHVDTNYNEQHML